MSESVLQSLHDRLMANKTAIAKLKEESDALTWEYVRTGASDRRVIDESIAAIELYLKRHYTAIPEGFLELLRANITMAPITETLFTISKYGTQIRHNTVLYEWQGKRVMYVRADENCDHYYAGCDFYNGFDLNDDMRADCKLPWWRTSTELKPKQYGMTMNIEAAVQSTLPKPPEQPKTFPDLSKIDDAFKILVPIFDLSERVPYLICEDVLTRYYLVDPSCSLRRRAMSDDDGDCDCGCDE